MNVPGSVLKIDGLPGLPALVRRWAPHVYVHRCWVHVLRNIRTTFPKVTEAIKILFWRIVRAYAVEEANWSFGELVTAGGEGLGEEGESLGHGRRDIGEFLIRYLRNDVNVFTF